MTIKLLVVEDDAMIRKMLAGILPHYGDFEIVLAADGIAAVAAVDGGIAPDVVLTDLKMPRMDGRGLLVALRDRGYAGPVALMTGFVSGVDVSGFAAVFRKPFAMADLARGLVELANAKAA